MEARFSQCLLLDLLAFPCFIFFRAMNSENRTEAPRMGVFSCAETGS
jgi:hypothetical protein